MPSRAWTRTTGIKPRCVPSCLSGAAAAGGGGRHIAAAGQHNHRLRPPLTSQPPTATRRCSSQGQMTPLMKAAVQGRVSCLELLLNAGANPHTIRERGAVRAPPPPSPTRPCFGRLFAVKQRAPAGRALAASPQHLLCFLLLCFCNLLPSLPSSLARSLFSCQPTPLPLLLRTQRCEAAWMLAARANQTEAVLCLIRKGVIGVNGPVRGFTHVVRTVIQRCCR